MENTLGRRLRVLRAERGLTQAEAAELAGVQRQTLAAAERGDQRPHDVTLSRIAKGYGVPVGDLINDPKAEAPELGRSSQEPPEGGHTPAGEDTPEVGTVVYAADDEDFDAEAYAVAVRAALARIPGGGNNDDIGIGVNIIDLGEGRERMEFVVKRRPFRGVVRKRKKARRRV